MAVCFFLKEVIVLLCIVKVLNAESDLLESIQLDASNPPELNEFLRNVIQQKQVFSWIRHAARDVDEKEGPQGVQHVYGNNMQPNTFNNRPGSPQKRNIRNRRPINDVHPYMFEAENGEQNGFAKRSPHRKRRRQKKMSNYYRIRRSKGSVSLDLNNESGSGEVKVAPRSESGVLNVPGQKYGSKHGIKRTCDDENEVHDIVRANTTKSNSSKNDVEGEYYFTTPHDVLGLDQDISNESENHNRSCLAIKKSAVRRQDNGNVAAGKVPTDATEKSVRMQGTLQNQIPGLQARQVYPPSQVLQQQQPVIVPGQLQKFQTQQLDQTGFRQHGPYPITSQMTQNKSVNTILANKGNLNLNDPKMQEFAKLVNYVDSASKESSTLSRQDLLKRDNDDVLENIDRVLKSDRSGLNLFRDDGSGVRYSTHSKREDKKSPREARNVENGRSEKGMDVDITLNAQPVVEYFHDKIKNKRRKANTQKKVYSKLGSEKIKMKYDTTPSKNLVPQNYPEQDPQTNEAQRQMISNPNLKIMENADDENDNNLKQTLKEYMNRQNQYNQGKQPELEEEEQLTPNYQLVQEKKNMLEDQTEPTSAAEQRELGKKDEFAFVTPTMNETDDALVVIPLKKDLQSSENAISNKNSEADFAKESFKVKEAKDVVHARHGLNNDEGIEKKEISQQLEGPDNSVFTKDVFDKVKDDMDQSSHNEIKDINEDNELRTKEKKTVEDYENVEGYTYGSVLKEKNEQLEPEKQADVNYDDYENFDMKRDISSMDLNSFRSRKLKSISVDNEDYQDGMLEAKIRTKRHIDNYELTNLNEDAVDKRSEDDEPDEEPGNDSKEPTQQEKKVQKSLKNRYSPKKEEGEMTLHLDPSYDMKRNDSENDFPPDDENDSFEGFGNGTKKGSKTIISYNYFNITVNMGTTTPGSCSNNSSSEIENPQKEIPDNSRTNQTLDDNSNRKYPPSDDRPDQKDNQLNRLAEDIIKYASKHRNKLSEVDTIKTRNEEVRHENDNLKDVEDRHPLSLNSAKEILEKVEDLDSKDTERSLDGKRSDDKDVEMNIKDQLHDIRSAVDNAKNRELLVSKLEHLVNSYKSQMQQIVDSGEEGNLIDKRSDYKSTVHHHMTKKNKARLPIPECVTGKSEKEGPMQKRVIKTERPQYVKPQEVYYEPESMADDLKEKLLFEKIYNRVVRKRKKAPDPFMYKIIDSVFGNEDDREEVGDKDMCRVEFDDDNAEGIETPVKRTSTNVKESTTAGKDNDLVDVSRQKKKTQHLEEVMEKELHNSDVSKPYGRSNMIKKQINEDTRIKLDNVDSFKDIIELPSSKENKEIHKRELSRRNLQDFPKSYLSPIDENFGYGRRRKRRRLKNLYGPSKQIRQINYNDYIQSHGYAPKSLPNRQSGSMVNFSKGQNYKVNDVNSNKLDSKNTEYRQLPTKKNSTVPMPMNRITPIKGVNYKITEKNCSSETEDVKANHSKMVECEMKKKEHEDMRRMLNGFLPMRIIDIFYDKLKENNALYNRFGGTIANSKQCASENAHNVKLFREEQAKVDIRQAEEMLHQVIIMLNQIVADQVHRRTCLQLAPNLKIFVIRITKNLRNLKKNYQVAEGYPLPKVKSRSGEEVPMLPQEEDQGDFLFEQGDQNQGKSDDKVDIHKKIKLVEKLLEKYQMMSSRCQVQVEPVKDYLLKHLGLLMKLLEKAQESSTCGTTGKDQEPPVNDDELSPPSGNISIPRVADNSNQEGGKVTTITTITFENRGQTQPSEVEQRQLKMLEKQQEEQKRLQDEERHRNENEQIKQDQQQQQELFRQGEIFEQPHVRESLDGLQQVDLNGRDTLSNKQDGSSAIQQGQQQQQPAQDGQPQLQPMQQIQAQHLNALTNQTGQPLDKSTQVTTATIVAQTLDPTGKHYTNPEMVTKNLLDLGLEGANTYLPPFDVNAMVQENVIKADMAANAAGTLIPHVSTRPLPKPAGPPKKRDVLDQEMLYEKLSRAKNRNYKQGKANHMKRPFRKSVTSRYSGKLMSKNQEMQDLLMTDLYSKQLFDRKRSINSGKRIRQTGNLTHPLVQGQQNVQQPQTHSKETGLQNYGKNQFVFQPLLVSPTQIPDPDIEDTEYYTGQKYSNPELVNKDLVAMGLDGEINSYIMPFTLDSVVQSQIRASTQRTDAKFPVMKPATVLKKLRGVEDVSASHWNVSEKYKKLIDTYHSIREKRQNEERIGKLYGRKSIDDKLDNLKSVNREINDISKVSFEKPIVFSLEG